MVLKAVALRKVNAQLFKTTTVKPVLSGHTNIDKT